MKTIQSIMTQLTDPAVLLREVRDTLRTLDPEYPEEETGYLQAAAVLEQEVGDSISPSTEEYLAALDQEIASGLLFVGWQGFRLNLECFTNPVNKLLLREDFEDLHLEHRMPTLPMAQSARRTIDAFLNALPQEKHYLTTGITSHYAYLQTVAYKLAHFFGFCLADHFLPHVLPGYVADNVLTAQYKQDVSAFLKTST